MIKLKSIPNILSIFRILLVGAFIYAFYFDYPNNLQYALIVFLSAGLSDVIDGFLARKFNWITNLGKILDPLADKLMQCTVLVCMLTKKLIPAWLVVPFICKEFLMLLGGLLIIKKRRFVVVSNIYGKMTVVLFYAAVVLCIIARDYLAQHPLFLYTICVLMLAAAISALINYATKYIKSLKIIPEENNVEANGVTDVG